MCVLCVCVMCVCVYACEHACVLPRLHDGAVTVGVKIVSLFVDPTFLRPRPSRYRRLGTG